MKNKLDKVLEKINTRKRIGIMTHLITGYPTFEISKKIAKVLVEGGADIIEIQIPFSDPMADGPLIVEASQKSLENGTKVSDSFKLSKFIDKNFKVPVVLMTYANIVMHMGIENFCISCKQNGVSGVIVPDLPYDSLEGKKLKKYCKKEGIHLIYVISPLIHESRLKDIKKLASSFIYCTSRQGTTGKEKKFNKNIRSYLLRARKESPIPLAVGFGISSSKDIKLINKYSDIAVVGSAIIDVIYKHKNSEIQKAVREFMTGLLS